MQNLSPFEVTEEVWMVPCVKDSSSNSFKPMCRPFSDEIDWEKVQCRQTWLTVEDETLSQIVSEIGPKGWSRIAKELNIRVHKELPVRQGKQCRERYFNHIDPKLIKGQWTDFEDLFILNKQREIGNKWSSIAKALNGRTENQIKNRFKSLFKKAQAAAPSSADPLLHFLLLKESINIEVPKPSKLCPQHFKASTMDGPSIGRLSSAFSKTKDHVD